MHAIWKIKLSEEFRKPYFRELANFVESERKQHTVYPPVGDVFKALEATPSHKVKVVILGQDPYHGSGQAHGLSFSVKPGVRVPPSLGNIFKELSEDVPGFKVPNHGCLTKWAEQGILLLNSVLTVRQGEPGSHQGQGWETFTDAIIKKLNNREQPVVFILWGRQAQAKRILIDDSRHFVIESAHPSPMSAHNGFFGSRPFSKINKILRDMNQTEIDWNL